LLALLIAVGVAELTENFVRAAKSTL